LRQVLLDLADALARIAPVERLVSAGKAGGTGRPVLSRFF
jgi:hypothetical protein